MTAIKINQLTFAYDGSYDNIFENVSFQFDSSWKLGFTGRNGRGKTTFLKILSGELEYKGQIHAPVNFQYFPFAVADLQASCLKTAKQINPEIEEWALARELALLDLSDEILERPFMTLSEGEKTKLLLAILFLKDHAFLLIDEPTNHLDHHGRACVSRYLQRKESFLLVSHDRAFIDSCIDHVLSIEKTSIDIQKGTFSSLLQNKAYQDQYELAENEKLLKDIDRLGRSARRASGWADQLESSKYGNGPVDRGYIGHKSAKMMKRAKHIERRRENSIEEKKKLLKNLETVQSLELRPLEKGGEALVHMENLILQYDETPLLSGLTLSVKQGDRIALTGPNGCGKSSVLKVLLSELGHMSHGAKIVNGMIRTQSGLKISYVSQDTSGLNGSLTDFSMVNGIDEALLKSMLIKLDFKRIQFEKDIAEYSEGQKKKLLIAKSICEQAHLYIWDEPLNYIDVLSRIQIEEMLLAYKPTMIFVEHDQTFVEAISTHIVLLD